jgi:hypothetical protein
VRCGFGEFGSKLVRVACRGGVNGFVGKINCRHAAAAAFPCSWIARIWDRCDVRRRMTSFCFCCCIDSGEALSPDGFRRYHASESAKWLNDSDLRLLGIPDLGVECWRTF